MNTTISTHAKIDQLRRDLCHEFPQVRSERVQELMAASVDTLRRGAHFDDFVPLLAYRTVRERIRDEARRTALSA